MPFYFSIFHVVVSLVEAQRVLGAPAEVIGGLSVDEFWLK
jgi:hypothetical protein